MRAKVIWAAGSPAKTPAVRATRVARPCRSGGITAWLVRSPPPPRSSSRAHVASRRHASLSTGVNAMAIPLRGLQVKEPDGIAEEEQPLPLGRQPRARPARVLRGQDVALGVRHQAEDPAGDVTEA